MYQPRLQKLYNAMDAAGLDSLVVNPGSSFTYLTGLHFHTSERPTVLFFTPGKQPVLVLPKLESIKLKFLQYGVQGIA